jgi:SAM-dependent methyltransferase
VNNNADASWHVPEITESTVERYKKNFSIPSEFPVTKELVKQHVDLEYELTQKMLLTPVEDRPRVWAESYDELYRSLRWRPTDNTIYRPDPAVEYGQFLKLIPVGAAVIEIGSGDGGLARYLTDNGRPCVATEVTLERGDRKLDSVVWHQSDGIHLTKFEQAETYDAVVSTQVIEHFHPDDVEEHFRGAFRLLRRGGQYVFATPHAFLGPADLSRIFPLLDRPRFMHLKEYTHRELGDIARRAGFSKIEAVYVPPTAIRKRLPLTIRSRFLYRFLCFLERALQGVHVPSPILRGLLFHADVFMVVTK